LTARAWARLVRLPNLPTPLADIGLGLAASFAVGARTGLGVATLLGCSSLCLYTAGMVLNDWCDREDDAVWRADRPLPSGAIGPFQALVAGFALLGLGLVFAGLADLNEGGQPLSFSIALLVASMVLLYDTWAKRTPLGPLAMGSCRGLNVLLGASASGLRIDPFSGLIWIPALTSALYIAGVTWFARTEEKNSNPLHLRLASGVIALALGLAACATLLSPEAFESAGWFILPWSLMGLVLGILLPRLFRANRQATPGAVQSAVGWMIALYIPVQAAQACGLAGPWGLLIVPLFAGVLLLRRWRWLKAT